jgi:outer membrane protein OmpA-like peptidoglycan-associated protein
MRLQTKLLIGASNDLLEHEADRLAEQVTTARHGNDVKSTTPRIQRRVALGAVGAGAALENIDRVLTGSGRPLEPALRKNMEQSFGHDFSRVRLHTGSTAEQSAQSLNAKAYTVGSNIVFGAGAFAPGTRDGTRLLAHELTHVVQQSGLGCASPTARYVQRQPAGGQPYQLQPSTWFLRSSGHLVIDAFPTNRSTLTPKQVSGIHAHAQTLLTLLQMDPGGNVYVTGYADAPGTEAHNLGLGRQRAEAVRAEMVAAGVPRAKIQIDSAGESRPVHPGPGADPANRRAVIGFSPALRLPAVGLMPGAGLQLNPPALHPPGATAGQPRQTPLPDLRLPSISGPGPGAPTLPPDLYRTIPPPVRSHDGLRQFFERDPLLRSLPDFLRNAAVDGLMSAPDAVARQVAGQMPAGERRDAVEAILRALAAYMTGHTWSPPPDRDPRFDMPPPHPFPSAPGQFILHGPTWHW